ncbi:MAG: response regulator [Chloroflexota bacterium]
MAHILIVDDLPEATRLLSHMLATAGHTTVQFTRGEDVVTSLEQEYADLLVVDLNMPEMDGFAFVDYIRTRSPQHDIPIVVATASRSNEDRFAAFEVGADAFITKPFTRAALLEAVDSLLHLKPVEESW